MSQSQSLIRALGIAERLLLSDEDDLMELSRIAGIAPEILYQGADLSGVNLKGRKIDFLIDAGCNFDGAEVSSEQRRKVLKARRLSSRAKQLESNVDNYIEMMHGLIDWLIGIGRPEFKENMGDDAYAFLWNVLVSPLVQCKVFDQSFSEAYFCKVLDRLTELALPGNADFFARLFKILGAMRCSVSVEALVLMKGYETRLSENGIGRLIAEFHAEATLDTYWLSSGNPCKRAEYVSHWRELHPMAVERIVLKLGDVQSVVEFLEVCKFTCDGDAAERIAATITNAKWPSRETQSLLSAPINFRVSSALFRQLVAQSKAERIIEVVKWLEAKRGAAGALSLESAFQKIPNFEMAWELGEEIFPRLAENQKAVVRNALLNLAYTTNEVSRVNALR